MTCTMIIIYDSRHWMSDIDGSIEEEEEAKGTLTSQSVTCFMTGHPPGYTCIHVSIDMLIVASSLDNFATLSFRQLLYNGQPSHCHTVHTSYLPMQLCACTAGTRQLCVGPGSPRMQCFAATLLSDHVKSEEAWLNARAPSLQ